MGKGKGKELVDSFGAWFQTPRPASGAVFNFHDASIEVSPSEGGGGDVLRQVPKSPENNCYLNFPVEIAVKPSDDAVARVRQFLCTTFAGQEEARQIDAAAEALACHGFDMPHVMVVFRGPGGDGKSVRTA